MTDKTYRKIEQADDVTEEVIKLARDVVDGWYADTAIDWDNLLDRIDGAQLASGEHIDLSANMLSPAIVKLKREIRAYRALQS